ncbi:MAG: hypothetical protein PHC64_02150 [Candidatus Gastranaerophilales bacterium]|nr:hypothetical protein [Candidatus Gastranaerophilales bacterium]
MFIRTYTRTFLNDLFKNNFLIKTISRIVNFYCKLLLNNPNKIKFCTNIPINQLREKKSVFFQSVTGDKIDCK